jgi:hypothetical protein
MDHAQHKQSVFDDIAPGIKHKNPRVRQQVLSLIDHILHTFVATLILCIRQSFISLNRGLFVTVSGFGNTSVAHALSRHGGGVVSFSKVAVDICALMADPAEPV